MIDPSHILCCPEIIISSPQLIPDSTTTPLDVYSPHTTTFFLPHRFDLPTQKFDCHYLPE